MPESERKEAIARRVTEYMSLGLNGVERPLRLIRLPPAALARIFDCLSSPLSRKLPPFQRSVNGIYRPAGPRHARTAALASTCRILNDFYCREYVNTLDLEVPDNRRPSRIRHESISQAFWRYPCISCIIYPLQSKCFGVRLYALPQHHLPPSHPEAKQSPPARAVLAARHSIARPTMSRGDHLANTTYMTVPLIKLVANGLHSWHELPLSAYFQNPLYPLQSIFTQTTVRSLCVDPVLFTCSSLSQLISCLPKLEDFSLTERPEFVHAADWNHPPMIRGRPAPISLQGDILAELPTTLKRLSLSSSIGAIFCPRRFSLRCLPKRFSMLTELHLENCQLRGGNCAAIGKLSSLESLILHGRGTVYTRSPGKPVSSLLLPFSARARHDWTPDLT